MILDHVATSGHNTQGIAPTEAFAHVKALQLQRGETLLEAGSPPGFVYIPMIAGLRGVPCSFMTPSTPSIRPATSRPAP